MIVDGHASLVVLSTELTAVEITRALGVEPTTSRERGEPRSRRRPDDRTGEHAYWCVDVPGADGDDPLEPIRALARVFRPRIEALNALRAMCDVRVWWHGSSDSAQGGFVMDAALLADLAALGCDLYGTTYLDDSDPVERG